MNQLSLILLAGVLSVPSFGYWNCISTDSITSQKGRLGVAVDATKKTASVAILRVDTMELTDLDVNSGWYYLGKAEGLKIGTENGAFTAKNRHFDFRMNVGRKSTSKVCGTHKSCFDAVLTATMSIHVRPIQNQKLVCRRAQYTKSDLD